MMNRRIAPPAAFPTTAGLSLLAALFLSACGSNEPPATLAPEGGYAQVMNDPRPMVEQITAMSVEPMEGGVIIRATGLPPTQGYWKAALISENAGVPVNGERSYRFVAIPPLDPRPVGTEQSRAIEAAAFLSNHDLEGVRQITVQSQTNQRVSRR